MDSRCAVAIAAAQRRSAVVKRRVERALNRKQKREREPGLDAKA